MAENAVDALKAMFTGYGMGEIATWIADAYTVQGKNLEQISVEIYDQPAYQKYFPAMAALRQQGKAITEGQYRAVEQGYKDVLNYAGLAGSVYDNGSTFQKLIESSVSTRELEERVNDAKMVAESTDPNVQRALKDYYGISANDLMLFALDPKGHGKDHVERLARSATLQGIARSTSLSLSQQYTEGLAVDPSLDNKTASDYREILSGVSALGQTQSRLAGIEGQQFSDQDAADVVIKSDAQKTLASKQRAAREATRFAGTSGISTGSLKGGGI
jgi:hypothetical protein